MFLSLCTPVTPWRPHNGLVCCCTKFAAYSARLTMHCQMGRRSSFQVLSLVTLTFDLDIQTRPSEGPNKSSLWIWHKSIQWFLRYLRHKQTNKKVTNNAKTEPYLCAVHMSQQLTRAQQQLRWATVATIGMGWKEGGCCAPFTGAGTPSSTMWPRTRSTSEPSSVFIHPAIWPQ